MEIKNILDFDIEEDIVEIINSNMPEDSIRSELDNYHENDIAEVLQRLDKESRIKLYKIIGVDKVSEIFSYLEDVSVYLNELTISQAAHVLEHMDSDDAVDALENIEDEDKKEQLISLMSKEASNDIKLISSYSDDEIGSMMTTNFISISSNFTIKEAMRSLISQSKDNDNINTIYVIDDKEQYFGAIDLRDLIIARDYVPLEDIISRNYPSVIAIQNIHETIETLKDYAEDSIPVLNDRREILGVITSQGIVEAVDNELGDDYAKLAGLTAEEDVHEKLFDSIKKRMPWLLLLLFLGMGVSSVVGAFEGIVAQIAIVMCFQSLILDMAGNVGTQSLAVTIRVLMDENVSGASKAKFILKEMQIGASNGLILGSLSFVFVGMYLHYFKGYIWIQAFDISSCVGIALLLAMIISSLVGTIIPMFFHKIKVDPAVASGPLITTINDLVAVISYYGLAGIMLVGKIN